MRYGILIAAEPEARSLILNGSFAWQKRAGGSLYESSPFDTLLVVSGIGKAFASARCADLCAGCDTIINIGTAGSLRGASGVVIADSYVEYDMLAGAKQGVTPYCGIKEPVFCVQGELTLLQRAAAYCSSANISLSYGCCASADRVVDSQQERENLSKKFGAIVCDMEAAAAAKVAALVYAKPFTSIKCISDSAAGNAAAQWKKEIARISSLIEGLILAITGVAPQP